MCDGYLMLYLNDNNKTKLIWIIMWLEDNVGKYPYAWQYHTKDGITGIQIFDPIKESLAILRWGA
jgi:hypothetical protein